MPRELQRGPKQQTHLVLHFALHLRVSRPQTHTTASLRASSYVGGKSSYRGPPSGLSMGVRLYTFTSPESESEAKSSGKVVERGVKAGGFDCGVEFVFRWEGEGEGEGECGCGCGCAWGCECEREWLGGLMLGFSAIVSLEVLRSFSFYLSFFFFLSCLALRK
ncbi:hypothetical protein CC80DRAFT_94698 [Byssothecium circinans]|uniref:Uncharacterized protein n=1 Tax=Byssothecium circinans TaxID=147558 RepID=A0A6A5TXJ3_9PLEO|nr:hypothetical protein CC80DRAFT_94698 [Byssothecium circinans]